MLYEIVPPDRSAPRESAGDLAEYVARLLTDHEIDAVNIPEIRAEERDGDRVTGLMEKQDPRQFGRTVTDLIDTDTDIVVNHVVVYEPENEQRQWFNATFEGYGIENVVVVGGESSDVEYPGPGVTAAIDIAKEEGESIGIDPCLGGITIPTRRRDDFDEPERMLTKQRRGIEFFTSQIIFEAATTVDLLHDYAAECADAGVEPAPIFLSFAPITGRKDIRFLEWLGVEVPPDVREWVLAPTGNPAHRSVRVAEHVLAEVLTEIDRNGLNVPIGINVEHIMRYNFEASELLLDQLTSLIDWFELKRESNPVTHNR